MRERGSNTARPTEKGGGGLPIGARPVDFGASIGARPVDFGARPVDFGASIGARPVDFGASIRSRPVDSARVLSISSRGFDFLFDFVAPTPCRHPSRHPSRHHADTDDKTQKSPIPQSGDRVLLSRGVARFYASTNSSRKYMCKRSKRSTRSCASILHRDANVWPSAYCALYFTKHAHS